MDISGGGSMTLAFSLSALRALDNPKTVITGAKKWTDNIGVITAEPLVGVVKLKNEHQFTLDFSSGPRDLKTALEETTKMIVSDRFVYLGTSDEQRDVAEECGWEYIPLTEAADAAGWETTDSDTSNDQPEHEDRLFVPLTNENYYRFTDDGKTWELRGLNDQYNPDTVVVGRAVELRRGYSTDDSLWGEIVEVETFDSVDEIVDELDIDDITPGLSEAEFRESVDELLGKYDEYIAFKPDLD